MISGRVVDEIGIVGIESKGRAPKLMDLLIDKENDPYAMNMYMLEMIMSNAIKQRDDDLDLDNGRLNSSMTRASLSTRNGKNDQFSLGRLMLQNNSTRLDLGMKVKNFAGASRVASIKDNVKKVAIIIEVLLDGVKEMVGLLGLDMMNAVLNERVHVPINSFKHHKGKETYHLAIEEVANGHKLAPSIGGKIAL